MQSHQLINQSSGAVEYYTPPAIIEAARRVLGTIDLDPASCEIANRTVRAKRIFTEQDNGLEQVWSGRVWMNHPFSRAGNTAWIEKLIRSYGSGGVTEAICICFASTSEGWFQPLFSFPQCFLSPRTNYVNAAGVVVRGVSKGSVVTYLGHDRDRFAREFEGMGAIK